MTCMASMLMTKQSFQTRMESTIDDNKWIKRKISVLDRDEIRIQINRAKAAVERIRTAESYSDLVQYEKNQLFNVVPNHT